MNFEQSMTPKNWGRKWGLMADSGGRCSTLRLRYYNSLFTNALFSTINPQQTTGPASIIDSNQKNFFKQCDFSHFSLFRLLQPMIWPKILKIALNFLSIVPNFSIKTKFQTIVFGKYIFNWLQ